MNKFILFALMCVAPCNAAEKQTKVTLVSCYSSTSSKSQKHELVLSDGTCLTLRSSHADPSDIKITITQKKEAKK